ncbi:MAG: hypothetical protein PHC88_11835 [Terrimicrobiaceae bacterium]|nr:hypothetical protein [Terrimicrobiaceae bacterium]
MNELSEIQKLIRLKRYEQPPEGYFDDFLLEFQRRQRAEMLRRPLWQIAWERANLWLDGFRVPAFAYATILVAAVGITTLIVNSQSPSTAVVASVSPSSAPALSGAPAVPTAPVAQVSSSANLPPSYSLEKRPVSYDAPFSF